MKNLPSAILVIILTISFQCYADAPYETYFLDRTQIPDNILRNTKAVLTVNITDPKAYAEYYGKSKIMDTPYISIFKKNETSFNKIGILNKADIKTPTGGEYGPISWYRFPVIDWQGEFLKIVYNLSEQKKCWVNFSELKSSSIYDQPVLNQFTNQSSSETVTVDIFYLTKKNEIKLYNAPSLKSASQIVTPASKILTSSGAYDAGAFQIVEQKNGLARLVHTFGLDMPTQSIGWIRLRDKNGLLLLWPILGYGC